MGNRYLERIALIVANGRGSDARLNGRVWLAIVASERLQIEAARVRELCGALELDRWIALNGRSWRDFIGQTDHALVLADACGFRLAGLVQGRAFFSATIQAGDGLRNEFYCQNAPTPARAIVAALLLAASVRGALVCKPNRGISI